MAAHYIGSSRRPSDQIYLDVGAMNEAEVRVGCAVVIEAMRRLQTQPHPRSSGPSRPKKKLAFAALTPPPTW
jgi:hypothetical protein